VSFPVPVYFVANADLTLTFRQLSCCSYLLW